ncbi:calcium-activated potassium channel subunit beta-3 [Anguilla anguilla]|uniref:calcium-activated potassium channel subunit beta-3 n=1 Tax=Anguilla anguilla TaxID=7936 RepID=UPI0015B0A058|nr:calcium-activated potassium channel subunit beta-3 [Anguilla anguilla]
MLLNPSSRRGSHSIPVHINLQSVRRRPDRQSSTLYMQEVRSKGERGKTQAPISSVGEERAILLGLSMIGFSLLMYFLFGTLIVNPCLRSNWTEESNCTVIQASFPDEWEDDTREFRFPCLNVTVNLSRSDHKAQLVMLYYNEDALDLPSKCFYRPKYRQNISDIQEEAQRIHRLFQMRSEPFRCFSSQGDSHLGYTNPGDAILTKKCDNQQVMQYMFFSTLMLAGGVMTISLVRLNQHLSRMVAQFSPRSEEVD